MTATLADKDFRLLLDATMCLDPSPLGDEMDAHLRDLLDRESTARGYAGWIEAFHRHMDMRAISVCRHGGWHSYMAGPCFDTYKQAVEYRDYEDRHWRLFGCAPPR